MKIIFLLLLYITNSLPGRGKFNMFGVLHREGYPKQHNLNAKGSYAKVSKTTNKNICATDPCLVMGAFPYFAAGLSIQQSRYFYLEAHQC